MSQLAARRWIGVAVALVGVVVLAANPMTGSLPRLHRLEVRLIAGAEDITIDFVRHGQSVDNADGILGTAPPGVLLTDLGQQQADHVAPLIRATFPDGIDGIYASDLVRTQETARPLMDLLGTNASTRSTPACWKAHH